jgi:hypothetical protein
MNLHLASTAELYAEHRRTGSDRKRQRIANELQRRHDEQNCVPGLSSLVWWQWSGPYSWNYDPIQRYDFALLLPAPRHSAFRVPNSHFD